jgi:hypothetical protein
VDKQSSFAKLWLPSLSLLATIVSVAKDRPTLAWSLFALTILLFLSEYARSIIAAVRSPVLQWRDDRTARRVWPEVQALVQRFGPFVDSMRGDNIHALIHHPSGAEAARLLQAECLVPIDVLYGIWDHVRQHAQDRHPDSAALHQTLDAFTSLLHVYNRHVFGAVFYRCRSQLRPLLNDDIRSSLELCREQYTRLADDYTRFIERTNAALLTHKLTLAPVQCPGPL